MLSEELGYSARSGEVEARLREWTGRLDQVVLVAEEGDGPIVGWIHAYVVGALYSRPFAEVGGMIVRQDRRRRGIGRLLMAAVEQWSRRTGMRALRVRSRIERQGAHEFYENLGFERLKTQHVFVRRLTEAEGVSNESAGRPSEGR
jgi:GNAT superfamily N-acetyltransferase